MPVMKFVRITVGDKRVCSDCIRFENLAPATLEWWQASGYMPRQAPTECGMKCRCGLVPATFGELQQKLNEVIEKTVQQGFGETVIDLTTGRRLLLREFEQLDGLRTMQYEKIAEMENLILKWKIANNGVKLPGEFFQLQDIGEMIKWLEGGVVTPISLPPMTKAAVIKKLKDLGVKTVDLTGIDDVAVLAEIESQLSILNREYRPVASLRAYINDGYARSRLGGIGINKKWFNNFDKVLNQLKNDKMSIFHPNRIPDNELIKSVLSHEFAHDLTVREISQRIGLRDNLNKIRLQYRKKLRNMKSELEKEIFKIKHKDKLKKYVENWKRERADIYISEYAAKDLHEFTAEAFADYKHSQNPSPYSVEVGKLIDAKYKAGGKK